MVISKLRESSKASKPKPAISLLNVKPLFLILNLEMMAFSALSILEHWQLEAGTLADLIPGDSLLFTLFF